MRLTSSLQFLLVCLAGFPVDLATADESSHSAANAPSNKKSARCTVRQQSNGWWLVDPNGKPFFSLGICMLNQGLEEPTKPGYIALRHYDKPEAWADASLLRLKSWGFNTVGGWSDYNTLRQSREHNLWVTCVLSLGARSGSPWFDMWDDKVVRRIDELAGETIALHRGDVHVLGYYSDNELGWWNAILWKMTLEQPATSGQRTRLVKLVRETYRDDWGQLVKDFEPQGASNWLELERAGMLWLQPGSNGIRTMRQFLGVAAERYYQLMRDAIHKLDPDALYLGDRYQSFYYAEVPLGSRRHVDVVSTNLNVSWNDGTFTRSFLETLHGLTGKPVLVSEFYMAAEENESGNRNRPGGFPTVANQALRADALSNTLLALVHLPYVVGADWFQYYDEPPNGRSVDGEDYNFGLVNIRDEPYKEVTTAFKSLNLSRLKLASVLHGPDANSGVPAAPKNPLGQFQSMTALKNWDRRRGFVPPATPHPLGDLYICWNSNSLYLATIVQDIVEADYYSNGEIPEIDRAKWDIRINDGKPFSARLGAGKKPTANDPAIRIESISGTYHQVRCITAIELPAAVLGKNHLAPGDRITIDSAFTTHARANRIDWKGTFILSK